MPRPKGKKHPVRVTVSLDPDDHAALTRMAADNDLSVAWIVRRAVAEFVQQKTGHADQELPLQRSN